MIELWYINVTDITQSSFDSLLANYPLDFRKDINRYRNFTDQKLKFFGKWLIEQYHIDKSRKFNWNDWGMEDSGKPFLRTGVKFNITHAGSYVLVAFSDKEVGVDIEKISNIDFVDLVHYFHPIEENYILESSEKQDSFCYLWTRKEAFLKAKGIGIIDGLKNESCLEDFISDIPDWYIYSLKAPEGYKLAVCTPVKDCQFLTVERTPLFNNLFTMNYE